MRREGAQPLKLFNVLLNKMSLVEEAINLGVKKFKGRPVKSLTTNNPTLKTVMGKCYH